MSMVMDGNRTLVGKSMVEGVRPSARAVRRAGGLFRILVGIHFGDGPPGCRCEDCEKDDLYLPDRAEQIDQLQVAVDTCKDVAGKAELQARLRWVLSRRERARNHVYRARRVSPIRDAGGVTYPPDPIDYSGDLIDSPTVNLETQNQAGSYKFERVHEGNTPSMLGPITPDELARRGYSGPVSHAPENTESSSPPVSPVSVPVAGGVAHTSAPPAVPGVKAANGTDAAKATRTSASLDAMSTAALRDMAEAEEVDLSKCKNRDDMLKTLKTALGVK